MNDHATLRNHARTIWQAAVAAADPFQLVHDALTVAGTPLRLAVERAARILIVGGGKAGAAMAAGAEAGLADRLDRVTGLVNAPRETVRPLQTHHLPTRERWRFVNSVGEEATVTVSGPLRANNADALTPAVLTGLGLAVQPEFVVWQDLAAGRLEAVMTDWSLPPISLNLVAPPGALRPPRVTAVIEFLIKRLSQAPWASAGEMRAQTLSTITAR